MTPIAKPLIKYAGGKRAIADEILARFPKGSFRDYYEPFVGSGAVFFALYNERTRVRWEGRAFLSDTNSDVTAVLTAAREDRTALMEMLSRFNTDEATYYDVRSMNPHLMTNTARAARCIYLNKVGFNGLYRVNSRGEFNVPFGKKTKPALFDEENMHAASAALFHASIRTSGYGSINSNVTKDDVVYLDPPYIPISKTSSFAGYQAGGFNMAAHIVLRDFALSLKRRGAHVILSNSSCDAVRNLYSDRNFKIEEIDVPRRIGAKTSSRGMVKELLIT